MKTELKQKLSGILGTIVFHILVLCCFIFFGLTTPLPIPQEEGVEVNLGNSDDGMGEIQPLELNSEQAKSTPQNPSNNENDAISQNTEETAKINDINKNKKVEPNNEVKKPEQPKVDNRAIYKGNSNKNGGNEGETGKPGDQGNPNGNPNAKNHYGTPGNGHGVSFSLTGRKAILLPQPSNNFTETGTVVVSITVNKSGDVVRAEAGARGTTTTNPILFKLAKEAAFKTKFDVKNDANDEQKGSITYHFIIRD